MTPTEIKVELLKNGLSQSDIARACKVSRGHVFRVVQGNAVSHPVQMVLAHAIGKTPEEVFPERYGPKGNAAQLRQLAQYNDAVRKAG